MRRKSQLIQMGFVYHRSGEGTPAPKYKTFDCGVRVPDVVRNVRASDGWRKPSSYSCEGISGSRLYSEFYAEGWSRSYRATFQGNSKGSTQSAGSIADYSWQLPAIPTRDTDFPSHFRARAINEALRQLQNRQGHILETIAEFRSSVQGITRCARSIIAFENAFVRSVENRSTSPMRKHFGLPKGHRALKEWKRKLNGVSAAAKTFSSAWLTFWFGLAPVVSDMVLFMRILGDSNIFLQNLHGKGRGFSRSEHTASKRMLDGYYSGFDGGYTARVKVKRELGVYVSLTCRLNKSKVMEQARKAAQLGSFDGLSTAWAIMPYSWLIDFVLPVSQYLKGWEGRQGLDFRGGTITYYQAYSDPKIVYEKHGKKCSDPEPLGTPQLFAARTFRRSVLTNLPAPVFQARIPADLWKATTALSLLMTKLNPYFGK